MHPSRQTPTLHTFILSQLSLVTLWILISAMRMCLQVRADSALRGIGRPVRGVPGRGRPTAVQNPVARAFSQTAGKAARRGGGGLLSGHVSSTEEATGAGAGEGLPPRTAAEALAAMQSRLVAESPSTHPQPNPDFSSQKAPDTQVPSPILLPIRSATDPIKTVSRSIVRRIVCPRAFLLLN